MGAANPKVRYENGARIIRIYGTDIVRDMFDPLHRKPCMQLFTGGWHTPTTLRHINKAIRCMGWQIHQVNYQLKLRYLPTGQYLPFSEGCVIYDDGLLVPVDNLEKPYWE